MTVNSYLFQSPYSQPVQVGRADPLVKEQKGDGLTENTLQNTKATLSDQANMKPTLESGVTINVAALTGASGQKAAETFNSAYTKVQAQNAYQSN
ncbi:MAG: hypothetical protein PHW64_08380 [Sulfuricurvum sp.]|nr:hypothetical protein [Sulfuricurvum sp.]